MTARRWPSLWIVLFDIREGFVETTRHSLALIGLGVLVLVLTFATRTSLQVAASEWLMGWLASRHDQSLAEVVQELLPEQTKVTHWLSRKYRISPQALRPLVSEAWQWGQMSQLPPTLILAVMAVASEFNPFAQGTQGTVGLMQVDPIMHADMLEQFGGKLALFDPQTNLRIGARLLQSSIQQGGSVREGVRLYGQSSGQANDSRYVERVMAQFQQLERIVLPHSAKPDAAQSSGTSSAQP